MEWPAYIAAFGAGVAAAGTAAALAFGRWARRQRRHRDEVEKRARRAEQLAYAGTLAGGLIHEIKNPLNTLSLNLQLLAEDLGKAERPEERRALKRVRLLQSETLRLAAILDDFLGFVRGHRLMLGEREVNEVVDEVLTFVRPDMESKGIEIRKGYGDAPRCRMDVNLVKQVLLNLLLNAEQAMAASETREIIVRTAREGEGARIDVIDAGKGIAPEAMGRIFEAFYSTKKGGTGLGLPTARRIVEEHGGRLSAHSEPGRGSCFTLTLPVRPPGHQTADRPEARRVEGEALHGKGGGQGS